MNFKKLILGALAAFGLASAPTAVAATNMVSGYLYGTNNWTSDNTYILTGFTYVMSNAVLNIEAGTVIQGVTGSGTANSPVNDFGTLFVCQGGKLNALGTATRPVIFTADNDDVTDPGDLAFPTRGSWGGVVLLGNARINNPAWTTNDVSYDIYEGLPDTTVTNTTVGSPFLGQVDYIHRFGGSNDEDSSGVMRYASVRHGGKKLSTNKEINGWSMGGVGRGTTMEYLEAYCIADDGFEFFGGSVNTKHLVSAFNDDDCFDTDEGYNGKNQFWFAIQEPTAKDNGSEQNGQPEPNDVYVPGALPLPNYVVRNATLIGAGSTSSANNALRFRRGNMSSWINSVFTGFGGIRVRIDDDGTSTPTVANNIWFDFAGTGSGEDYGGTYVPAASNPVVDPQLRGISRSPNSSLDPRTTAGSPAFSDVQDTPVDGFWTPVAHKGAFDANDNWAYGWSALSAEEFFAVRGSSTNYVGGYLYGTNNWTANTTYILTNFVYVMSNAVLNIEAGTVIQGVTGSGTANSPVNDFGTLFVCQGGKLNALGTANSPVIFTADNDDVTDPGDLAFPTRGSWGGVVLLGNARINNPAWTTNDVSYDIYEGLPDTTVTNTTVGSPFLGQVDYIHRFGGSNDDDSSGVMRYASVRHGGKKLSTNKEINGWSMGGVGRGTTMEYLEAFCIADDGFEFFGGSVNTKYLISAFNDDDCFDTDEGYNGKNQFWFAIQEPGAKDNGSEQNGQPEPNDVYVPGAQPLPNYVVRNATLIGAGSTSSANNALRFRRGNMSSWINSVFTGFGGIRVRIDDDGTSTPTVANNIWFDFAGTGSGEDFGGTYVPAASNPVVDPQLRGISRTADQSLNPTVASTSPVYSWFAATPADGFYTSVSYVGAFDQENWAQDWSGLDHEGFLAATAKSAATPVKVVAVTVTSNADGSMATVSYPTTTGVEYKVQSTTDVAVWTDETSWTAGTGATATVNSAVSSKKIFRVITR